MPHPPSSEPHPPQPAPEERPGSGGPFPPVREGGPGARIAAASAVGVLLLAAIALSVGLLKDSGPGDAAADDRSAAAPSAPVRTAEGSAATARRAASTGFAHVVLSPGACFDHPLLDKTVAEVEERPCDAPHDGEVIANHTLTAEFATRRELRDRVMRLCKADADRRIRTVPPDGTYYYFYALYPDLDAYRYQNQDTVSCALTLGTEPGAEKLTAPLGTAR
ncbi:hypothetical protein AB0M28_03665 [Streptomyces sp. NPDC051940]|uniref:hypothetical protein n=1 Tax=Streptomyces sp. NPDC051940 TaxID=3155675 RepID=UPI0034498B95